MTISDETPTRCPEQGLIASRRITWPFALDELQAVVNAWGDSDASAFASWAMWSCDTLGYLAALDAVAFADPITLSPVAEDFIFDIAHVRWATTTAVSAVDLCAAILGRRFCGVTGPWEMSFADLFARRTELDGTEAQPLVYKLPAPAQAWAQRWRGDQSLTEVRFLRHNITHSRPGRTIKGVIGATPPRSEMRAAFAVNKMGKMVESVDVIEQARDCATACVAEFLSGCVRGDY